MQRKWLVAALTAASVAALASPAAAWGTRSHAQAYGAYGWDGPGFGVTVGGPYAADWGWGGTYAASPGGCTCGSAAYGWGYPNYGWSGYAYSPGYDYGYSYQPGWGGGWGADYGWYGGRREFREGIRGRDNREFGTGGREFTRGRERGMITTGQNFNGERTGTVGTNVRGGNFGAGQGNFNANANGAATVGKGGAGGRQRHR